MGAAAPGTGCWRGSPASKWALLRHLTARLPHDKPYILEPNGAPLPPLTRVLRASRVLGEGGHNFPLRL